MNIVAYYIALGVDPSLLEKDVNKMILEGYIPFGSVFVFEYEDYRGISQPMVKYA